MIDFEDECVTYNSGDAILVSVGQPHKARTGSDRTMLFLVDDV